MAWDPAFKNTLQQVLGKFGIKTCTETEIPRANQRIDFIVLNNNKDSITPFKYSKMTIIGEFKSEADKLQQGDLYMLVSKALALISTTYGYGNVKSELQPIDIEDTTCLLILGGNKSAKKFSMVELVEITSGLYELPNNFINIQIIELDNYELEDKFAAIKIFAGSKIRKEIMKKALLNGDKFIISISYFLYGKELNELASEVETELSPESISIRAAVDAIGLKRVVDEIGLKRVVDEIGLKRVVDEIGLKRVVDEFGMDAIIQILLENYSYEQIKEIIERYHKARK